MVPTNDIANANPENMGTVGRRLAIRGSPPKADEDDPPRLCDW